MKEDFATLPRHWIRTRLDRVASINARIGWKALSAAEYQSEGFIFLATPNIKTAEIDFERVNFISEFRYEESPELKLRVGDVLLAKDGNTLGITNVVRDLPRPATVNGSIAVIRPRIVESRFLRYVLDCADTQGRIASVKDGMGVPHLFQRDINRLPIPLPPSGEQHAIADFLDAETVRIDALIAKKRRLASLLEERQGLLVRKELGRVERVLPLRRILSQIQTGTTPTNRILQHPQETGTEWFTPADICSGLVIRPSERQLDSEALRERAAPRFPADSVLIVGIGATAGRVGYLDREGSSNQQITCLVPNRLIPARLLAWQLAARADELRSTAPYTTLPILNNDFLLSLRIRVPSSDRSQEILQRLDKADADATTIRRRLLWQIDLLAEHRQALITAAVTGQLEVPGTAAS